MRSIAVIKQKGGVGKTTTAVNVSAAIAAAGHRVCVIDLDPQGGAILIFVQGSREDVTLPGGQPVDPAGDPERIHTTDWVSIAT